MDDLIGYRNERGLLWPGYDRRCAEVTFEETAENIRLIRGIVPKRRVAVQAGGNCGQLVREMAQIFDAVYTFEPDPMNFVALTVNTAECANVFRFQAALGTNDRDAGLRGMIGGDDKHPDDNCGALYMKGEGKIPTISIDDLGLVDVDLIMLDVEGGELAALQGAAGTLFSCKPAVIFENKDLGHRFYGEPKGGVEEYLTRMHRYQVLAKRRIDLVMAPA